MTMPEEAATFYARVGARAGQLDSDKLQRATLATLRALGAQLQYSIAPVDTVLPASLVAELRAGRHEDPMGAPALYVEVARTIDAQPSVGLEVVQSVVAAISDQLGDTGRQQLRGHLPEDWAALVVEPRPDSIPAGAAPPAGHDARSLATGRPGASRTLADAGAPDGHRDSIAASDDPHGDRKLSSTRDIKPAEAERTLARGRPGSNRSLADGD